jgi:glycine/D-amino acid oxidase-like deaminating enzyme
MQTSYSSYWPLTAAHAVTYAPLTQAIDTDVVIIGAGILGLSAALHLAERGVSVAIVEAQQPAAGASGANGGLVVPSLPRLGPQEVYSALGDEYGGRMVRLVAQGAQVVFDLIEKYALDCSAVQGGWINPAHASELEAGLKKRVDAWRRAGSNAMWLDRDSSRARIGSQQFHGALFDPTGGHLNPYAYTQALAKAATQAGVKIFGDSVVTSINVIGNRRQITTAQGSVTANKVVQCTNAMGAADARLSTSVANSFVPLTVFQLATEPLAAEVRAIVLPGNHALSDTRNNLFAMRYTADHRLVTGGMAPLTQWLARPRLLKSLAARMGRLFPELQPVKFEYIWQGTAALTPDFLPRLMLVDEHWLAPLGCNGRGIAMSTSLGQRIAHYLVDNDPSVLPLPLTQPRPIMNYQWVKRAPQILLPLGILQDALRR